MTTLPCGRPLAWRANFTACSFASAPPNVKNTRPPSNPERSRETLSQRRARLCAPARIHEAQSLSLLLNGAYQARVLMAQVHALRQAAHIEVGAARFIPEPRSFSADDGRRVPIRLNAPAMQDARVFRSRVLRNFDRDARHLARRRR